MSSPNQIVPIVQTPSTTTRGATYLPGPFEGQPGELDRSQLDIALQAIFSHSYTLAKKAPDTPTSLNGMAMSAGALQVKGKVNGIATGLSTVSNIVVSLDTGGLATNLWVTANPSATLSGTFDVQVWKPTAANDNTPIPATALVTVRWHAWGTK